MWCGGAWACSWWGELSPSPLSHRGLGAAAFSEAEAGFVPCREALGSPRPLRTKVFLASSQLSVPRLGRASAGLQAAGPGAAFPAGGQNPNQMFKCSPSAVRPRCALRLPRSQNLAPWHRAALAHGDGAGSGAAGGTTMGWLSQPRALPHAWPPNFLGRSPGRQQGPGEVLGDPRLGGGGANMGSIVEVTGQLGRGEIR